MKNEIRNMNQQQKKHRHDKYGRTYKMLFSKYLFIEYLII